MRSRRANWRGICKKTGERGTLRVMDTQAIVTGYGPMNTCFLITHDPLLAQLTGLMDLVAQMGFRVEIRPRPDPSGAGEKDILVVDARGEARDLLGRLLGVSRGVRVRTRVLVIVDERASSEQRAELLDAGVLSAVPANPARLASLLAEAIRDAFDEH